MDIPSILHERPLDYQKETVSFSNYDIEFSHVVFHYMDGVSVLNDISFKAAQGTTTALIGSFGSGKTTIVSLLARFWDVQSGFISIGGEKINEISPNALTKHISIVFQDVYLLNDTVFNNIRIGKPGATKEEVIQTAFQKLKKGKTVLVIAHRFGTILGADNIIVLDKGRILETGTHKELKTRNGWYASVYEEQCLAENWKVTIYN